MADPRVKLYQCIISSIAVLLMHVPLLQAQRKQQDVIYLKNGSVIRNIREMQHLDSLIKVTTADGSVIVFSPVDIQKMSRENAPFGYREKGYLLHVEAGMLAGRSSERGGWIPYQNSPATFSASVVNGYRFNRLVGVGLGLGVDTYQEGTLTPLFLRGSGHLLHSRFSPVYALDAGYGFYNPVFNGKPENNDFYTYRYRGGIMGNVAGGIQVFISRETAFHLLIGYRLQQYRSEVRSDRLESHEVERILFRRLALKAGFAF